VKVSEFTRRWWPVGVGAALGIATALALVAVTPKSYTATSVLFLGAPASSDSSGAYNGDLFSQQRASTYSQVVTNRDLAVKVIDDLALSITPEQLSKKVSASQIPKTVLVRLSVTDGSAQRAANIANAYASDFTEYIARLETPVGSSQPISDVSVIQKAELPTSPTSPNTLLNILGGLVGGIVIGLFAKWLMRTLNRRVRNSNQVAESTGAPVLGVLPKDATHRRRRLNLESDTNSEYAEAVRKLRTNLLYADVDAPPRSIAFISPTSTVATTATAANLAVVLDGIGRKVALIDADVRESRLARYLGGESGYVAGGAHGGLTSVITGAAAVDDVVVSIRDTGVDVVFAGPPTRTASEALASDSLAKLFNELQNSHDFVICDTPGLLTATDAAVVGLACDGVVVLAVQGKTRIEDLSETVETLRSLGAKIIGAVLTEAR
jgi:polysaccharide biosynthesis transport protein